MLASLKCKHIAKPEDCEASSVNGRKLNECCNHECRYDESGGGHGYCIPNDKFRYDGQNTHGCKCVSFFLIIFLIFFY